MVTGTLIETQQASLDTLSVTIQALHVNGKQMTLAVFRQLPIDDERPDSVRWGVVRYSIKDTGDLWLIFSHDNGLYRRSLSIKTNSDLRRQLRTMTGAIDYKKRSCMHSFGSRLEQETRDLNDYVSQQEMIVEEIEEDRQKVVRDTAIIDQMPQLFIAV